MFRVRNGVGEMLGPLFDRYHVALFNFFYRLTDDRTASEDLVQDCFYRILKYRESYRPGSPFRTWMYQIARNARADLYRKQGSRPEVEGADFEAEVENSPAPIVLPVDRLEGEQQASRLRQALMQLPEEKREVLILSRFQELKYEEIAKLLECDTGTVKVRVHRALQQLKENFRRLEQGARPPRTGPQESIGS